MTTVPQTLPEEAPESRMLEIQATLRKLDKRDWWLWSLAIVVMLLLTLAVVSLSFPGLMKFEDPFFQFSLNQSVRGLVALVLLFNTYTIYQQVMIKRLRRQLSEQLDAMGHLRTRAEEFQAGHRCRPDRSLQSTLCGTAPHGRGRAFAALWPPAHGALD